MERTLSAATMAEGRGTTIRAAPKCPNLGVEGQDPGATSMLPSRRLPQLLGAPTPQQKIIGGPRQAMPTGLCMERGQVHVGTMGSLRGWTCITV
jgi:hypothetical protein